VVQNPKNVETWPIQVTTKVGLTRNLRSLKWFESVDTDDFFPRSYDLHDPMELFDWVEDFKILAAENLLRKFLRDGSDVTDQQGKALGRDFGFRAWTLVLLCFFSLSVEGETV
jgi:hypothetical protein